LSYRREDKLRNYSKAL